MKAIAYHEYGPPENLEMLEMETPAVKADQVLVKVHAASVNALDWHFLTGTPFMVRLMAWLFKSKNKVLGIVRSIDADQVIDYTQEDFAQHITNLLARVVEILSLW